LKKPVRATPNANVTCSGVENAPTEGSRTTLPANWLAHFWS
jgi:hypothetical protein